MDDEIFDMISDMSEEKFVKFAGEDAWWRSSNGSVLYSLDKGEVTLTSVYGDKYNLKSALTQYVAVAALVGDHGEELELWCTDKDDEKKFLKMFNEHPEML